MVVLNGLPIVPEIVVLNSFIGVVLKIYCKTFMSMVSCKSAISKSVTPSSSNPGDEKIPS